MRAQRTGGLIVRAMEAVGALSLLILMFTVFVDVVGRNLLNTPLLALGFGHITVDLIRVRPSLQVVQRVLSGAMGAVVFSVIAWCMVRQALRAADYGEATPLLGVPLSWVLGGIGVLAAISALAFLLAAVRSIRHPGAPHAPHATEVA